MALTNHDNLVIDFGNGYCEEIYYDEKIKNYRGKEIGIWSMDLLFEILTGEIKNISLRLKEE